LQTEGDVVNGNQLPRSPAEGIGLTKTLSQIFYLKK